MAQRALLRAKDVVISPLVEVEFASAIARKQRTAELDTPTANRILSTFRQHVADGHYRRLAPRIRHFDLAREWLGRFCTALRTLDALHLAMASDAALTLLTADQVLVQAAAQLGVSCQTLSVASP